MWLRILLSTGTGTGTALSNTPILVDFLSSIYKPLIMSVRVKFKFGYPTPDAAALLKTAIFSIDEKA